MEREAEREAADLVRTSKREGRDYDAVNLHPVPLFMHGGLDQGKPEDLDKMLKR